MLHVSSAAAQVLPGRDNPLPAASSPAVGTASISGTVTVAGTGDPARRARVTLNGGEPRIGRTATTDDHGRFAVPSLPAGRYNLSVSKPGHVTVSYGQRQPGAGRPGTAIQLADDERFEAHLVLPRGSVLTGTVVDEHGEATPGTSIRALRYTIQNGQRTLQQAGTATTDDRGIYRIFGLQPADYVVCAMPRAAPSVMVDLERMRTEVAALQQAAGRLEAAQAEEALMRARALQAQVAGAPPSDDQRTGYAAVCYPGTTVPSASVAIPLGVGQERGGVDFQLQLVPVGSVEGMLVSPVGATPQNVNITLSAAGAALPGMSTVSTRAGADGRFRLHNVSPGQYRLTARGTLPTERPVPAGSAAQPQAQRVDAPRVWASADISVDGRDVTDVVLALQPGLTVSGHLAFNGGGTPPADLSRVRLNLSPVNLPGVASQPGMPSSATVDASGRFTIPNVVPGLYRLSASGAAGWTMESAVIGGQDSLDYPVDVRPGQSLTGALVTFTDRQTEVSGAMTDGRGQPVPDYTLIIFPSDPSFWTPGARRIQSTRPGTDGRFIFRNLPPGEYRVATVLDPEPGSWTDPGYLRELEAVSLRVTLTPGEKKVQNIRLAR